MERLLLERLELHLDPLSDERRCLRALASARALIANPDSFDSTRCSIVDALIRSLDAYPGDPAFLRPALKLLGKAAILHHPLAPSVIAAVRPFLDGSKSLVVDAIVVLASIAESSPEGGGEGGVSLLASVLDEDLVLSLASSPISLVRSWILDLLVSSIGRAQSSLSLLRPHLMLNVLLGLAVDLYLLVRRAPSMVLWRSARYVVCCGGGGGGGGWNAGNGAVLRRSGQWGSLEIFIGALL